MPSVNKVVINKNTVLDLTSDTVAPDNLLEGYTAHNAMGLAITGQMAPGFPGFKAIPSGADLNNYTEHGEYGVANSATALSLKNTPINNGGFTMFVGNVSSGGYARQLILGLNGDVYARGNSSTGWTNWRTMTSSVTVMPTSAYEQLRADVDYLAALQGVDL